MVTVAHSPDSAAARATPAQKVTGRSGEPLWKTAGMVLLVVAVIGLFIHKAFTPKKKEEQQVATAPRKQVTAADLLVGVPLAVPTRPSPPAPTQPTPPPTPPAQEKPPADDPPTTRTEDEGSKKKRMDLSSVAVRKESPTPAAPAPQSVAAPHVRHVPRGTIMSGFLESRILSDNLDSRVRVLLIENFCLSDDVILPAGGTFIGQALEVGSRYQKRLAVRVGNYIYPDGEREVPFSGLLLNPDESAHMLADDVQHHTGRLIAGTTALAVLGAATGVLGSARGEGLGPVAGANAANSLGELAQRNVQGLTTIMPTLVVEPGKPCWIFVDQSFDVPEYAELPKGYAPQPPPTAAPAGPAADPRLEMMRKQMEQVDRMMAELPMQKQGVDARQ